MYQFRPALSFTLLFIWIAFVFGLTTSYEPAWADSGQACHNCPDWVCSKSPRNRPLLEKKKAIARIRGIPERLIRLLDHVTPVCPKCIESARSVPMIVFYDAKGQKDQVEWTVTEELIARRNLRSGKTRSFYITWMGPCDCCNSKRDKIFLDDGLQRAVRHSDGILTFETPSQLGNVPDLGGRRKPLPKHKEIEAPSPPRFAQPLCAECSKEAKAVNEAAQKLYQAEMDNFERKKSLQDTKIELARKRNSLLDAYYDADKGELDKETFDDLFGELKLNITTLGQKERDLSGRVYGLVQRRIIAARKKRDEALTHAKSCEAEKCVEKKIKTEIRGFRITRMVEFDIAVKDTLGTGKGYWHDAGTMQIEMTAIPHVDSTVSGKGKYTYHSKGYWDAWGPSTGHIDKATQAFDFNGNFVDNHLEIIIPRDFSGQRTSFDHLSSITDDGLKKHLFVPWRTFNAVLAMDRPTSKSEELGFSPYVGWVVKCRIVTKFEPL